MIGLVAGLTAGPAFLALLGPAGTGKTWMLQAAAADLRRRGQPVVLVRRGELPIEVFPGTAVLVDEAARMDDGQLARLAAACGASVVLADLPAFAARLERLARPPAIIPLAPLAPEDMPEFVAAWLAARGAPAGVLTQPAVARLFDQSGGIPRLVVQLLRATLAMHGDMGAAGIGADAVDEMAALRLGGFDAGIAPPPAVQDAPHTIPEKPGVAPVTPGMQDTPGMADEEPAATGPVPPSEAPASPPPPPKPAPTTPTPATPTAGVSAQPRRRVRHGVRRAVAAAMLPALAASVLAVAVLAVHHVQQASDDLGAVPPTSETTPTVAGAARDAATPAGGSIPGAQPPPIRVPNASMAIPVQPEAAPSAPPSPTPDPSPIPNPVPSTEAAATPGQDMPADAVQPRPAEAAVMPGPDPAVAPSPGAPSPGQAAMPAPNPSEPAPPDAPAQAVIPPAPDRGRLASVPSVTVTTPFAAPSAPEPVPAPMSEPPKPQSLAQAGGAPGLVLVAHAGDTMLLLYFKVYRGVTPPPYLDVVAINHLPLRPGSIVVFPPPQEGWPER